MRKAKHNVNRLLSFLVPLFSVGFLLGCGSNKNIEYNINVNSDEVTISKNKVKAGEDLNCEIGIDFTKVISGTSLPNQLDNVNSGNRSISSSEYIYELKDDNQKANFSIPSNFIEGDISISLSLVYPPTSYTLTFEGTNCALFSSYDSELTINTLECEVDKGIELVLKPNEGFRLPTEITFTPSKEAVDGFYDPQYGTIFLVMRDNVKITATTTTEVKRTINSNDELNNAFEINDEFGRVSFESEYKFTSDVNERNNSFEEVITFDPSIISCSTLDNQITKSTSSTTKKYYCGDHIVSKDKSDNAIGYRRDYDNPNWYRYDANNPITTYYQIEFSEFKNKILELKEKVFSGFELKFEDLTYNSNDGSYSVKDEVTNTLYILAFEDGKIVYFEKNQTSDNNNLDTMVAYIEYCKIPMDVPEVVQIPEEHAFTPLEFDAAFEVENRTFAQVEFYLTYGSQIEIEEFKISPTVCVKEKIVKDKTSEEVIKHFISCAYINEDGEVCGTKCLTNDNVFVDYDATNPSRKESNYEIGMITPGEIVSIYKPGNVDALSYRSDLGFCYEAFSPNNVLIIDYYFANREFSKMDEFSDGVLIHTIETSFDEITPDIPGK